MIPSFLTLFCNSTISCSLLVLQLLYANGRRIYLRDLYLVILFTNFGLAIYSVEHLQSLSLLRDLATAQKRMVGSSQWSPIVLLRKYVAF